VCALSDGKAQLDSLKGIRYLTSHRQTRYMKRAELDLITSADTVKYFTFPVYCAFGVGLLLLLILVVASYSFLTELKS